MKPASVVYFMKPIGLDGPIKIGCTIAPEKRLNDLSVWSPLELEILATAPGLFSDEMYLHNCFADQNSHREWFHSSPSLRALIERVKATGSIEWVRDAYSQVGSLRKGRKHRPLPEYREGYRSYSSRVLNAERRLRKIKGAPWAAPDDVQSIIDRWNGSPYRNVPGVRPTAAEFVRLDKYLADPISHSHVPDWDEDRKAA